MSHVPALRVRVVNDAAIASDGKYVLYWMIANRRPTYNFSLQRAVELATELRKPLLVFEGLRCDYPWASDRLHQFVIGGMADNARYFQDTPALYYPYLEPTKRAGRGLLQHLAKHASVVVSDDFPCFFLPHMVSTAARQMPVRFELVDSNGLLPMRAADRVFARAYDFRRFLQKQLLPHLADAPEAMPLANTSFPMLSRLPSGTHKQWPSVEPAKLLTNDDGLLAFPIDHDVRPTALSGGYVAAARRLQEFCEQRLDDYEDDRNQPERNATSGLSPYLHFGHISAHQVFDALTERDEWTPGKVAAKPTGSSSDWWGTSASTEMLLDQLITWRELGYNMCWQRDDYDKFESLPAWAQRTLDEHASDVREHCYDCDRFEQAATHDKLWNAAQRQLKREGHIHNYLRMLWGKKILHWSATPRDALDTMIHLNNKYALDGRNPNSYSGIFWVLGRYDRAWGPERPIFGKIRYMTSENTARKVKVKQYIATYSDAATTGTLFE